MVWAACMHDCCYSVQHKSLLVGSSQNQTHRSVHVIAYALSGVRSIYPSIHLPIHVQSNSMADFWLSLQVYIDKTNVDDDLVKSIIRAAEDPNAAEVFYRVIGGNSGVTGGGASVNQLLNKLDNKMPMLLLWGDLDPWIGPGSAARVKKYYPKADRVGIQAGHCPHDEKPAEVDRILVEWADKL